MAYQSTPTVWKHGPRSLIRLRQDTNAERGLGNDAEYGVPPPTSPEDGDVEAGSGEISPLTDLEAQQNMDKY